jgi:hypothetical protein
VVLPGKKNSLGRAQAVRVLPNSGLDVVQLCGLFFEVLPEVRVRYRDELMCALPNGLAV